MLNKKSSKLSEQNAHYFKFRDELRRDRAKGNFEEFKRLENQGFFNDDEWKMLTEKYSAENLGDGEIGIKLESLDDLNEFLADIDISSVEYIPYKATFVHGISSYGGGDA